MMRPLANATALWLYAQAMRLLSPLIVLYLAWRSRLIPEYRQHLLQRFGVQLPPLTRGEAVIWIHAASLGETLAVAGLIEQLLNQYPNEPMLVTSTTPTGRRQVRDLFGDAVYACWAPIDTPGSVQRLLSHYHPRLIALVETEIWPSLVAAASRHNTPVVLLNARLSKNSARRYRQLIALMGPCIRSLTHIAAQHVGDSRRFLALGASQTSVSIAGSVKYDVGRETLRQKVDGLARELADVIAGREVLVAASTHPGEEGLLLAGFAEVRRAHPGALLILAPRHVERIPEILALPELNNMATACRSRVTGVKSTVDVLLLDTVGELAAVMGLARLVLMAGSWVPHGGHNPIEAAIWGVPIVTGPSTENFTEVYRGLLRAGGAERIIDPADIAVRVSEYLDDVPGSARRGAAGQAFIASQRGATQRQLRVLRESLSVR